MKGKKGETGGNEEKLGGQCKGHDLVREAGRGSGLGPRSHRAHGAVLICGTESLLQYFFLPLTPHPAEHLFRKSTT